MITTVNQSKRTQNQPHCKNKQNIVSDIVTNSYDADGYDANGYDVNGYGSNTNSDDADDADANTNADDDIDDDSDDDIDDDSDDDADDDSDANTADNDAGSVDVDTNTDDDDANSIYSYNIYAAGTIDADIDADVDADVDTDTNTDVDTDVDTSIDVDINTKQSLKISFEEILKLFTDQGQKVSTTLLQAECTKHNVKIFTNRTSSGLGRIRNEHKYILTSDFDRIHQSLSKTVTPVKQKRPYTKSNNPKNIVEKKSSTPIPTSNLTQNCTPK